MELARSIRRVVLVALVALVVGAWPGIAAASHLIGGTITWQRDPQPSPFSGTDARYLVTVSLSLRASYFSADTVRLHAPLVGDTFELEWGPATGAATARVPIPLVVEALAAEQDWLVARGTVAVTLPLDSPDVRLAVRDCCLPTTIADGNGGAELLLEARIPAFNPRLASPRVVTLPRVDLEQGQLARIDVAPADAGPLATRYRPAPPRGQAGPSLPAGMVLDEATGVLTWTPLIVGEYDLRLEAANATGAIAPLELLVRVVPPPPTRVAFAASTCGAQVPGAVGVETTLALTATSTIPRDAVTVLTTPLPSGATLAGAASPTQLRWTPALDGRSETVCLLATSASGASSYGACCVDLVRTPATPPPPLCAPTEVPDPDGSTIAVSPPPFMSVGDTASFVLRTYDACHNPLTSGGHADLFDGAVLFTNGPDVAALRATDLGDGSYRFDLTPHHVARSRLDFHLGGALAETTPGIDVQVRVAPLDTVAPQVTIGAVPALTNQPQLAVTATADDEGGLDTATVFVNGIAVGAPRVPAADGTIDPITVTLAEGANTILVQYRDRAGNVGGSLTEVTLDTVAPVVSFVTPAPGQALGAEAIDVTIAVDDASTTLVSVNGGTPLAVAAGGAEVATTVHASTSGPRTLTAFVTDAAGNAALVSLDVLVDLDAPAIATDLPHGLQLGPQADDRVPLVVVVMSAAATTVTVADATFVLPRGGGIVSTDVALVEGTNTIDVTATDELGRTATLGRTVIYDVTAPAGRIVAPTDGELVRGVAEVVVDVERDATEPVTVTLAVDDVPLPALPSASDGTWRASLDTGAMADGAHALVVTLVDGVGNARALTTTFVTDQTAPTVVVGAPAAYVHGTIALTAEASDDTSGVDTVSILVNGSVIGVCDAPRCVQAFDTRALADGPFVVSARAADAAGNVASAADVIATAVNGLPAGFLVAPAPGASIDAASLTVEIAAPATYFASAECFFDGASLGVATTPTFARVVDLSTVLDGQSTIRCEVRDLAGQRTTEAVEITIRRWQVALRPANLDVRSGRGGSGTIEAEVRGVAAELLVPIASRALTLVVPGGTPVRALAGTRPGASHHVKLTFDRRALVASIGAGIAGGFIDPAAPLHVTLLAGARTIGDTTIRVTP